MEIEVECKDCGATGLYRGFCEGAGEAVICLGCSGSGKATIQYKPFTGRKRRMGIKSVSRSRGAFIATGVGAQGKSMTYEDFLARESWG